MIWKVIIQSRDAAVAVFCCTISTVHFHKWEILGATMSLAGNKSHCDCVSYACGAAYRTFSTSQGDASSWRWRVIVRSSFVCLFVCFSKGFDNLGFRGAASQHWSSKTQQKQRKKIKCIIIKLSALQKKKKKTSIHQCWNLHNYCSKWRRKLHSAGRSTILLESVAIRTKSFQMTNQQPVSRLQGCFSPEFRGRSLFTAVKMPGSPWNV